MCGGGNAGTLRFNPANALLELCTGSAWQPMGVGIPAGTISAFASTTCPTGWSEYTPARGRFLRGIDNGAGNDPDGTRAPGAAQADLLRSHNHPFTDGADWRISGGTGSEFGLPATGQNFVGTTNRAGVVGYNGGAETRPKNVAVTYCQFNGTSNGWNNPLSGGSTVAGGSTGQLQYNTSGSFDGNGGLTWNNASQLLTAANISTSSLSTGNISVTTINGISLSALGGGASPTNVPAFRVYATVPQTVSANAWTKITFSTKDFDTQNNFDLSTGRFQPTVKGNYLFTAQVACTSGTAGCWVSVRKNNTLLSNTGTNATDGRPTTAVIVPLNGTTDYVEAWGYSGSASFNALSSDAVNFQGSLLASGNGLVSGTGSSNLSGLSDIALASPATGQVLTFNGTSWVNHAPVASSDRLTSGTLSVTANSATAIISLTTNSTTWGYLGSNASYLPTINTSAISATAVQISSNTAVTCGSGNAGTLRYNNSNTSLELCTGSGWQMMGVGIPAGTISAFASTTCPTGWSEYTPARGRFLRGIDNAAGNDPTGTRAPGNVQADLLGGHSHTAYASNNDRNDAATQGWPVNNIHTTFRTSDRPREYAMDSQAIGQTGGAETRPKNVAVTFCQFNGTSNGWNNPLSGGSTVPGGSTGQIQYNTSGSFDGNAGLTWTNASQRLTATNISSTALTTAAISTGNISASTINGIPVSALGSGASPTNVPVFRVTKNGTDQTLPTSTYTKLTWNTKAIDTYNSFDLANGRFTPTVAGNYLIHLAVGCNNATQAANACVASIIRNGTKVSQQVNRAAEFDVTANATVIVYLNGTTDYVEATAYNEATTASITGTTSYTYFEGSLLASGNGLVSGTGATALSAMSDVALTSPAAGSVLTFNGSTWVNTPTGNSDKIISGTTSIVAETGGLIRINTSGVNTGYFDTIGRLVTPGVSSTGTISGTRGYLTRLDVMSPSNTTLQVFSTGSGVRGGLSSDIPSTGAFYMGSYSDVPLALGTHNAERMRISAAGQVGIGTASPQAPIEVAGTTTARAIAQGSVGLGNISETGWNGNGIIFTNSYETSAVTHRSIVQNGGKLHFGRHSSSGNVTDMFLSDTGRLGVGTNSPRAALDSPKGAVFDQISVGVCAFASCPGDNNVEYPYETIQLPPNTNLRVSFGSYQPFMFGNNGHALKPGGGTWNAISDRRLKDVDGSYTHGLDEIAALKPIRFHYKKNNELHQPSEPEFVGLIAQDVLPHFPEAVHKEKDGFYRLDTTPISFAVINAVKELKAENDQLRAANDNLSKDLQALRNDFEDFKRQLSAGDQPKVRPSDNSSRKTPKNERI